MTTKPRVLQIGPLAGSPSAQERLQASYTPLELWKQEDKAAFIAREAQDVRVVVTTASFGCPADVINALPKLEAICSWGVGYDSIDVEAAHARKVLVSNTPDVLTDCVADLAWGLMLGVSRRIAQGDRYVREGSWGQVHGAFPLGVRVSGKKLGIVGLGRIGEAIARRGTGFDMDVRYHSRRQRNDTDYGYEASLESLAAWADYLVIATVGGPSTRHLINAPVLDALGPQGIIVNIARGSVIDEAAMVEALSSGKLGGAGLDVFEHEPKVPDALKKMDSVVLLPHVGSATLETREAMAGMLFDNLASFFADGKVITPV
ncbi:2-hydroxyacid dehydrogenase [Orrella dioscoreae]|uniref:D-3-phosphoglycerate dehydrogenase n=2 Tax=root TaxID=1 RepID=A0A1C3K1R0_9BURK|nr:2-hydroxyacid dehydrogenase [Orrella dioscoreae]SBT25442.1 D-3-phosphoglycerate dehydrogenase [Orrella dioscoreae]SOE48958.1 D-3-phosphoglycerate dehydrogenase [Orrella dioscoreae]